MEEENQVFGKNAEAVDNNINLESEDFYFYNQNKEEAKKNIDSSSKDLTDFIDSLIQDTPAPSDEEVNAGIEKILKITHPEEQTKTVKTNKKKKVTFRVLFIAALLSMISFSCLYVVGSSHNISVENGFVSFAKDTIQIAFFGENEEKYISVDTLLADLEAHGYEDILFPEEFIVKSDEYKASVPEYCSNEFTNQVSFHVSDNTFMFYFTIHSFSVSQHPFEYEKMENVRTEKVGDFDMYVFDFDNGDSAVEFLCENIRCRIQVNAPYSELFKIIKTLNKGE